MTQRSLLTQGTLPSRDERTGTKTLLRHEVEQVGPLVELGAHQTWQYICPVCLIPERFIGYDREQARAITLPKHRACAEALGLALGAAAALSAAPVPPPAPASPAPVTAPTPPSVPAAAPAAPVSVPTLGAPAGATPSLFEDERVWSAYQQAIFEDAASGTGHTTVLARAGTGKTTTLVETVRRMPAGLRVLVLAFNASIKTEIERKMPRGVEVRTLHSLGVLAVRRALPESRMSAGKVREILRREDFFPARQQAPQRAAVARLVGFSRATLLDPRRDAAQLCARAGVDPLVMHDPSDLDVPDGDVRALALGRLGRITAHALDVVRAEAAAAHDFDDMLWLPHVLNLPLGTWDRVVVDEAQDLSAVQIALLPRLIAAGGRVLVVGDDRQAIYAFRGADAQAFAQLTAQLGARVLPLTITYRCPRAVVALARQEVPDFEAGPGAPEGKVSAVTGLSAADLAPGDFVLSRTNAPLLRLFFACVAAGRPAVVQGRERFLDELIEAVEDADREAGEGASLDAVRALALAPFDRAMAQRVADDQETGELGDQRDCLSLLFTKCGSTARVLDQLRRLSKPPAGAAERSVCLSSVHRAKGLERERVWMLADTFRRGRSLDETNLWYVAVTRAKRELVLVEGVR